MLRLPATTPIWSREADVVVVGAGAAGLTAALTAARAGRRVLLLCKGFLGDGATPLAQGGLAAVLAPTDSLDLHVADTLTAGVGLCDPEAVRQLVAAAPGELARLQAIGADFDPDVTQPYGLALTREGGHTRDRVVHAGGDASGAEVTRVLVAAVRASSVEVLEHTVALDALRDQAGAVVGCSAARIRPDALVPGEIRAAAVVLATGGIGQAWSTTSNPTGATGDGLALALRAGAEVRDVEFVQFHPTVLWCGEAASGRLPLVSEAVRGEGAVLVDPTGARVMAGVHPLEDLAPRDVVAAAVFRRMAAAPGGVSTHVFLDATRLGPVVLEKRFPTVLAACRAYGIDPVTDPVPVAPGAHYACGGVTADLFGRTSVAGLYAVGEVACTGVQGANRLASNSVTEALVGGRLVGELLGDALPAARGDAQNVPADAGVRASSRAATARLMSRDAGVLRSPEGLAGLVDSLASVDPAGPGPLTLDTVEATSLHTVSTLVATAAELRRESRGAHRRTDVDGPRAEWERHITLVLAGDALVADVSDEESAA